jgi:hypothetical protein
MDDFEQRVPRGGRPIVLTIKEFTTNAPGLDTCICRKCGPCYEDAEVGREWCRSCLYKGCGMRKRAWEKLRSWFGAGEKK